MRFSEHFFPLSVIVVVILVVVVVVVTFHIFIFFSRTTRPISTKLGTTYYWVKGIEVCSNEGPALFLEEIITKYRIYIKTLRKSSYPEPLCQFQTKLDTKHSSLFKWRAPSFSQGDKYEIAKIRWRNKKKILFSGTTGPNWRTLSTTHPWMKGFQVC